MATVGLSLGSNLGDRLGNLKAAIESLGPFMAVASLRASGIYETEPVNCPPGSPPFYNAVIEFETALTPFELLKETQAIERLLGRPEDRERNAPRPVDLDILYYDELTLNEPGLILPHPRMSDRAFVLLPLAELRPDYTAMAEKTDSSGVERTAEELP